MDRTQPRPPSGPDAVSPRLEGPDPSHKATVSWTVLVCDPRPSRLELIHRIVSGCGARPRYIDDLSAIPPAECSGGGTLAVVALGMSPSHSDLGLEEVRDLKRKGFRVICYGEGVQSWPLSMRCQVMLAGSLWLLDSANAEFAQELRHLLVHLVQAGARRREEEERVKGVMRKLGMVGESPAILAVFETVVRVSLLSDLPILITGETGTGKELLAHAIHQLDLKRCKGPFVALNCSAISPGLAESELFGHRRGAFTGADRHRKGLIRSADGGVLFLDEIGELDEALQAKLLRVLQENRVLAVGDDREVSVSVRIIAATNRNLSALVQQRKFRADLFHRLNILSIQIPSLRERPADLKPLVEHFLQKYQSLRPTGPLAVDPDFIEALAQLELPGNVRQLENLMRRALVHKNDDTPLNLTDLPLEIWQQLAAQGKHSSDHVAAAGAADEGQRSSPGMLRQGLPAYIVKLLDMNDWNLSQSLQYCERLLIEAALNRAQGNQSQTARLLGITPRSVYNKVRKYRLHP